VVKVELGNGYYAAIETLHGAITVRTGPAAYPARVTDPAALRRFARALTDAARALTPTPPHQDTLL
jgi:hypothetical protein